MFLRTVIIPLELPCDEDLPITISTVERGAGWEVPQVVLEALLAELGRIFIADKAHTLLRCASDA